MKHKINQKGQRIMQNAVLSTNSGTSTIPEQIKHIDETIDTHYAFIGKCESFAHGQNCGDMFHNDIAARETEIQKLMQRRIELVKKMNIREQQKMTKPNHDPLIDSIFTGSTLCSDAISDAQTKINIAKNKIDKMKSLSGKKSGRKAKKHCSTQVLISQIAEHTNTIRSLENVISANKQHLDNISKVITMLHNANNSPFMSDYDFNAWMKSVRHATYLMQKHVHIAKQLRKQALGKMETMELDILQLSKMDPINMAAIEHINAQINEQIQFISNYNFDIKKCSDDIAKMEKIVCILRSERSRFTADKHSKIIARCNSIIARCNSDINAAIKDLANEKEIRNAILCQQARGCISKHISMKLDKQTNNTRIAFLRHSIADKKRKRDAAVQKWKDLVQARNATNIIQKQN